MRGALPAGRKMWQCLPTSRQPPKSHHGSASRHLDRPLRAGLRARSRFVRFVDDDGTALYYATYTAYNGRVILTQLMKTRDFLDFRVFTLNGRAVQNKGMALFLRRIDGLYAMISRQDDENLFIMFSDNPHFWDDPQILVRPSENWQLSKICNCGSPIETEAGWLFEVLQIDAIASGPNHACGSTRIKFDDIFGISIGMFKEVLRQAEQLSERLDVLGL